MWGRGAGKRAKGCGGDIGGDEGEDGEELGADAMFVLDGEAVGGGEGEASKRQHHSAVCYDFEAGYLVSVEGLGGEDGVVAAVAFGVRDQLGIVCFV